MLQILREHGSILPLIVMLLFVGIGVFVLWYVFTDRRRRHIARMEALPLDDGIPVSVSSALPSRPRNEADHG